MTESELLQKCSSYLKTLCVDIPERSVGSQGNRMATIFFEKVLASLGWKTETPEFNAVDWKENGATLKADEEEFKVLVSPYSQGCICQAVLAAASNLSELESGNFEDKILFVHGELAKEQLMPKNFVFYNPPEHQRIVSLLENSGACAIVAATGRNSALAGGVYPFPLIEDGDFDTPSVYMTEEEGQKLIPYIGKELSLRSSSERIPGKSCNVIGRINSSKKERIVITAHIDAKKGTPGAIDNATGVAVLLLVAELLKDYRGSRMIEIVAFNGEDYYAVPGQMNFIRANQNTFDNIVLNINIDGAGFHVGRTALSFFGLPERLLSHARNVVNESPQLVEGALWPQGDHSIFVQYGRPAIAVSSEWFVNNADNQNITHTEKDNLSIVNCERVVDAAQAIAAFINQVG